MTCQHTESINFKWIDIRASYDSAAVYLARPRLCLPVIQSTSLRLTYFSPSCWHTSCALYSVRDYQGSKPDTCGEETTVSSGMISMDAMNSAAISYTVDAHRFLTCSTGCIPSLAEGATVLMHFSTRLCKNDISLKEISTVGSDGDNSSNSCSFCSSHIHHAQSNTDHQHILLQLHTAATPNLERISRVHFVG